MIDCSIIIVSYNTASMTKEAVEAAFLSGGDLKLEVIVVDNNSTDNSVADLRNEFESRGDFTLIENKDNRGFAAANNQGAEIASGEILYFLNSDTLAKANSTERLVQFIREHPKAGAVGPRVYNADGSDQASTGPFISKSSLLKHYLPVSDLLTGRDKRSDFIPETTSEVDIVKGCSLCVSREAYDQAGGWDESYFLYSEETELCLALRNNGYTNYFVRDAEILHYGGASTSQENYADQQIIQQGSVVQYLNRHSTGSTRLVHRLGGIVGFGGRSFLFPIYALFRPKKKEDYGSRQLAAKRLFKWFLSEYPKRT